LLRFARNDAAARWIASRSLASGAHSRGPLARNDGAGDGLLRGACHRARIRATRSLAMTAASSKKPGARPGCWLAMAGRSVLRNRGAAEMVVQADANDVVLEADLRRSGDGSHAGAATRE
jgi:hypothetical protein